MNELEAKVERVRLQALLEAYEADRQHQRRERVSETEPNAS
jgi:hypothetical protein